MMAARELPAGELPRLLGELEEIRCTAMARLTTPPVAQRPDELLTVEQAAERLGLSVDYLYRNHSRLPFTRRWWMSFYVDGREQRESITDASLAGICRRSFWS
jgi:hypothetical protein